MSREHKTAFSIGDRVRVRLDISDFNEAGLIDEMCDMAGEEFIVSEIDIGGAESNGSYVYYEECWWNDGWLELAETPCVCSASDLSEMF